VVYTEVFALGLVLFGLGAVLWAYKKLHRVTAWLMGAGAFILTVAIVPWRDALAGLVSTPTGLVVLTGMTIASGIAFLFEAIAKHKHHRIRTPVVAATLGVTLVLAIADGSAMISSLGKSTSGTGTALSVAMKRIHSGAAARAVPKDHRYAIVALGVGMVIALVILATRIEKKKSKADTEIKKGIGRRRGLPPGRRAIPTGGKATR
jgi:hypothetical protein